MYLIPEAQGRVGLSGHGWVTSLGMGHPTVFRYSLGQKVCSLGSCCVPPRMGKRTSYTKGPSEWVSEPVLPEMY